MPGGQPIRLGPFTGGLNTASDPTTIADAEIAVSLNMELDIDGSLISRPPFEEKAGSGSFTERIVNLCEAVFSGDHYIIGSNTNGVFYYLAGAWTLITNTFQANAVVQYADFVYLVPKPGSANPGGKWNIGSGFTAVAAIPKGQAAAIHKERLFIAPGSVATTDASRLWFSDAGNFDSWPGTNFIDVSKGDGSNLVDLTVYLDNLVLFKNQSTYLLAYDIKPSDAILRKLSSTIGVDKQFNVVNYENQIYLLSQGWVYEVINSDFNRINPKVPFVLDFTAPSSFAAEDVFLSLVEDRLLCRFHKKIYVYGLRTRTWSEWESASDILHYFGPVQTIHLTTGNEYYAGSCLQANTTTIKLFDKSSSTSFEKTLAASQTIGCRIRTKNFDMAISHQFKRLFWWGADASTNNAITGIANPIVLSFQVIWSDLATKAWNSLGTWAQPLTTAVSVVTIATTGTGTARRFAKFQKSLRYRQINFEVQLTTGGSTSDGPARLFTMTIITESKETVVKSVN